MCIRDSGKGEVIALYPLMPDRMTVDRDRDGKLYYEYTFSTDDAPTVKGRAYQNYNHPVFYLDLQFAFNHSRSVLLCMELK